jgi:hypothetical protein
MRARTITPGRDYWVRVRLAPVKRVTSVPHGGWGFPGWVGRRRATVVAVRSTAPGRHGRAVVEADRWVCVNAEQFGRNLSGAMATGQLRYRPGRHRWTVSVRDVLTPAQPATSAGRADHREVA